MAYIGHDVAREQLEAHLSPVTLLRGPRSVGKRTLAEHVVLHHGFVAADIRKYSELSADSSREIVAFASTSPFGTRKCVIVNVDNARDSALNPLLKLLEEPPPSICFILTSTVAVLDTIVSRSSVHRLGLLSTAEIFQILTTCLDVHPSTAEKLSVLGRGQVESALRAGEQDEARSRVLSVLKAVSDGDVDLLAHASVRWDDSAHALLMQWIVEAITGRWQLFTDSETFGLTQDRTLPRRMLLALSSTNARPRLAIRVHLTHLVITRKR